MNKAEVQQESSFPPAVKATAKVISYLFHPLFIPVYLGWFLVRVLRLFNALDDWHQTLLLIQFFVNYTLLPLVVVLLAKGVGFIDSIYLKTQRDRIIPYLAVMVFYFWVWYVFRNQGFPKEAILFALAAFLSICFGAFVNTFFKVSMHALSMGVVITWLLILSLNSSINFGPYISVGLLIAGLVCTARLALNDHRPFDVYAGLFLGALAQVIAWLFV
jgi:uncharacterized membrane protein